jgi:predicted RNA polymerase sigma factor
VLAVLYLIFNEGYAASSGPELIRSDLCDEALRLVEMLTVLMAAESEVRSVHALMLLTNARRQSRVDPHGHPVLLGDQDRDGWDQAAIAKGLSELLRTELARLLRVVNRVPGRVIHDRADVDLSRPRLIGGLPSRVRSRTFHG